jgi:hypothetical protein
MSTMGVGSDVQRNCPTGGTADKDDVEDGGIERAPKHTAELEAEIWSDQMTVVTCGYQHKFVDYQHQVATFEVGTKRLRNESRLEEATTDLKLGQNELDRIKLAKDTYDFEMLTADTDEEKGELRSSYKKKIDSIKKESEISKKLSDAIAAAAMADQKRKMKAEEKKAAAEEKKVRAVSSNPFI